MTSNLKRIAKAVIETARQTVRCPPDMEYAIVFVGDAKMRALNRQYRGKDQTTNVLAFAGLGDIFISLPEAKREAKKYGWTLQYAIARLALHGFLHLLGYAHEKEKEAKVMENIEKKILQPLSLRGLRSRSEDVAIPTP